ncbi:hypothetical protein GGE07_005098 [Sinorhizobium terangae]|nr:hypothetical protein [Sinorhizobium terangae]
MTLLRRHAKPGAFPRRVLIPQRSFCGHRHWSGILAALVIYWGSIAEQRAKPCPVLMLALIGNVSGGEGQA